jgi:hypothetical protein
MEMTLSSDFKGLTQISPLSIFPHDNIFGQTNSLSGFIKTFFRDIERLHSFELRSYLSHIDASCLSFENGNAKYLTIFPHSKKIANQFKKETGIRFNQFMSDLRLFYAEQLLAHSGLSPTEICNAVGFKSYYTFRIHFRISRKIEGIIGKNLGCK